MFKHLIKKVREESNNASILPETSSDETNGHSVNDQQHENAASDELSTTTKHRRTQSNASRKSRATSICAETNKDEHSWKLLAEIFDGCLDETLTSENGLETLKSWIKSKEENLRVKNEIIEDLKRETDEIRHELIAVRTQLIHIQNSKDQMPLTTAHLQKQIDLYRNENENLKSTIKNLRSQLNDVESERDDLLIKSMEVPTSRSNDDEEKKLKNEIQRLRDLLDERDKIIEEQDKKLLVDHETQATQTASSEENAFVEILAEPNIDPIRKLEAELDDKNRTIKILQQRYNDLRKTLQREFHASIPKDLNQMGSNSTPTASSTHLPLVHYDSSAASQSDVDDAKRSSTVRQIAAVRKNVTFNATANSAILPHTIVDSTSTKNQKLSQRTSTEGQQPLNSTNFKYLKHVLLKFMTSTEDEAIHLIRAVSTLLNFSSDEERLLRETLDYKMSWFGKVSRLKPLSSNGTF